MSKTSAAASVQLAQFSRTSFDRGRCLVVQCFWLLASQWLRSPLCPLSSMRRAVLRLFGATIGKGVIIKGNVRVRYPWRLSISSDSWIGEDVWIDNWAYVEIGSDVCISQGAYLCTGNHDWSDHYFAMMPSPIRIAEAAWIGARSVISPGVAIGSGAVAGIGSVVGNDIPDWEIHAGNPAQKVRGRIIRPAEKRARS